MPNYVIVGDGPAGISAAQAIRAADAHATITVLSADPSPNYYRAALTNYLLGQLRDDELWGVPPDFYVRQRIGRYYGQVVGVDTARGAVALASGQQIPYDALLIASGATPMSLSVPGAQLPGVMTFRTLRDARRIVDVLPDVRQAVIVGGGTLGLEWVQGLRHHGITVTYILRDRQIMPRLLDATASELVLRQLRNAGVNLILGDEIAAIQASQGGIGQVVTRTGRQVPCQLVGVAIGVRPNIAFLRGSGVATARGILTDAELRTNVPTVFAAGDVAQPRDPCGEDPLPPAGLWQPARAQGRIAGWNMVAASTGRGRPRVYAAGASYVATHLYDLEFVATGETQPSDTARLDTVVARTAETYRKLLLRDGRLIGALLIGERRLARTFKRLIDLRIDVTPVRARLLDLHFDLADWTERQAARAPRRIGLTGTGWALPAPPTAGAQPAARPSLVGLAADPAIATAPSIEVAPGRRQPAHLAYDREIFPVAGERPTIIGRAPDCDIVLPNSSVSRRHAEIAYRADGYVLRDLGSANGTWVGLTRVAADEPQVVRDGELLRFGELFVTFELDDEDQPMAGAPPRATAVLAGPDGDVPLTNEVTSLGRAPDNDVVVADPRASRLHAQIRRAGDGALYLRDMGSANGTIVNGARVVDAHLLRHGDTLRIGTVTYVFRGMAAEERAGTGRLAGELTVVQGSGAGTRHPLPEGDTSIGRDPGNTVALADPMVTRRHAVVSVDRGIAHVRDLGSSNGSWVNGVRLDGPRQLQDGDTLEIGQTRFVFHVRPATAAEPLAAATRILDVASLRAPAAAPDRARSTLTIAGGQQDGERFPLQPGTELTIGRDAGNAIALRDAQASRRHAAVTVGAAGDATLRDLGSSNGTLVNSTRIDTPRLLRDGDRITVGATVLLYEVGNTRGAAVIGSSSGN